MVSHRQGSIVARIAERQLRENKIRRRPHHRAGSSRSAAQPALAGRAGRSARRRIAADLARGGITAAKVNGGDPRARAGVREAPRHEMAILRSIISPFRCDSKGWPERPHAFLWGSFR